MDLTVCTFQNKGNTLGHKRNKIKDSAVNIQLHKASADYTADLQCNSGWFGDLENNINYNP